MKTIHKYQLGITDVQAVRMPAGAEILSVQFQNESLCLWALVETTEKNSARLIYVVGTGNPFPEGDFRFIGTVQQFGGKLIWHVFEQT